MQELETIDSDIEVFPGALCRVRLADGAVLARNASAVTILGTCESLLAFMGQPRYSAFRDESRNAQLWGEVTAATAFGRVRFRMRLLPDRDEALVDMELMPTGTSEADLHALVDMIGDARWEWDLREGRVEHTGTGVMRSGIAAERIPAEVRDNHFDLVHPEDRERVQRVATDYLQGRMPRYRDEFRIRDEQAGGWRWVLSRGRAVERDAEGLPLRVVGLMSDISRRRERDAERSRLEAQLRHVQKLDALGQLTGGIAHDFNNILASVLGYAELGIMALGDSSEQVTGYMREIRSAADRGRELISKMLLFSRGNADPDEGDRVAPVGLVEETVRMLRPMLPATLTVETDLDPGLPPLGLEPTHLQQLLLNLTINARDAVGENGTVQIRAEAARPGPALCASCGASFTIEEGFLSLSVQDDGPGIPEHILENVFDPFFSTKETGRGSGLGLAVVHGIVHDQGGHITVESSDDGTRVRLLIPVATAPEREPRVQPQTPATEGRGRRILVIDDELAIGRWMAALLEMRDFVVDVYDNPRTALNRYALTPDHWDLVITDQSMPILSGVELADELLAENPDLPIIICSGYSEFVEASNATELGFRAFLDKPVSGEDLLGVVARVLDGPKA